jgi:hypothetical protein
MGNGMDCYPSTSVSLFLPPLLKSQIFKMLIIIQIVNQVQINLEMSQFLGNGIDPFLSLCLSVYLFLSVSISFPHLLKSKVFTMLIVVQIRYELIWGPVILREMAQTQFLIFLFLLSLFLSLSHSNFLYLSLSLYFSFTLSLSFKSINSNLFISIYFRFKKRSCLSSFTVRPQGES